MAVIISPYVGDARGKLGAGVYMRSKGQTLVRGYNPSPLNRRTQSQQVQRATFSAAVKFYTRGVQNLFNFAYEAKPTKESDYNAFMRYNAKKGMYFGPAENSNEAFPALAPWVMTRGSLWGKEVVFETLPRIFWGGITSVPVRTVAALSTAILASDTNYEAGDILTFVNIGAWIEPGSTTYPFERVPDEIPDWSIYQIVIDESDTTALPSDDWYMEVDADRGLGIWPHQSEVLTEFCSACCFVHSRVRNGKVYVSDSDLYLNAQAERAYGYGRSDAWRSVVMSQWGTEAESILQGSIAARQRESGVTLSVYIVPPLEAADIEDRSIVASVNSEVTAADVVSHLKIYDDESNLYSARAVGSMVEYTAQGSQSVAFGLMLSAVNGSTFFVFSGVDPDAIIQSMAWQ